MSRSDYAAPTAGENLDHSFPWQPVTLAGARLMPLGGHVGLSLLDVAERMGQIRAAGRTPKRIFIHRDLYEHILTPPTTGLGVKEGKRIKGKWVYHLLGVPVTWTKGKAPLYVVDDRGHRA